MSSFVLLQFCNSLFLRKNVDLAYDFEIFVFALVFCDACGLFIQARIHTPGYFEPAQSLLFCFYRSAFFYFNRLVSHGQIVLIT